jgi:hypothetical protein
LQKVPSSGTPPLACQPKDPASPSRARNSILSSANFETKATSMPKASLANASVRSTASASATGSLRNPS